MLIGAASGIAVALALDLVATAGAVFASQIAYSQTLAGIVWGMLLLGEQLPAVAWGAFGFVGLLLRRHHRGDHDEGTLGGYLKSGQQCVCKRRRYGEWCRNP